MISANPEQKAKENETKTNELDPHKAPNALNAGDKETTTKPTQKEKS